MAMPTRYGTFLNEDLEKKKIYADHSQQKDFLLVATEIYFVVTN